MTTALPAMLRVEIVPILADHAADSDYVREWWMTLLGPTATALLQLLVTHADRTWLTSDLAAKLGLSKGMMNSSRNPMRHALQRLEDWRLIEYDEDRGCVYVRSHLAAISGRGLQRLPPSLQTDHANYLTQNGTR